MFEADPYMILPNIPELRVPHQLEKTGLPPRVLVAEEVRLRLLGFLCLPRSALVPEQELEEETGELDPLLPDGVGERKED